MKNDILYSICPQIVEAAIRSFEQISRKSRYERVDENESET